MIVTIDGPAGAGKSSIAKIAADRWALNFLIRGSLSRHDARCNSSSSRFL